MIALSFQWDSLRQGKVASKRPLIENITQVMFKKGSTMLYWKEDFYEGYRSVEFLQKKVLKMLPSERKFCNSGQGIETSKKKERRVIMGYCLRRSILVFF